MIRINLLGRERPKVYRPIQITGPWVSLLFLIPVFIAGGFFYVRYDQVTSVNETLQIGIDGFNRELERLKGLEVEMNDIKNKLEVVNKRIEIIQDLKRRQSGPAKLLEDLGLQVTLSKSVWLVSINERTEGQLEFKGYAGSVEAIATLIKNLSGSEFFSNVEFQQSKQVKSGQPNQGTFEFTLTATFAIPKGDEGQEGAGAAPATATGGA